MINGYILGTEKLSTKHFKNKYWRGGDKEFIYQFHRMDISDGLDERQQLLINNDRALYKMTRELWEKEFKDSGAIYSLRSDLAKSKKAIAALIIFNTAIVGVIIKMASFLNNQ